MRLARGFHVRIGDLHHRAHCIDQHPDVVLLFVLLDLQDHDAGAPRLLDLAAPEARRQIDDWHNAPSQVDHAAHVARHHRYFRRRAVFDDLLYRGDRDAEGLRRDHESQVLPALYNGLLHHRQLPRTGAYQCAHEVLPDTVVSLEPDEFLRFGPSSCRGVRCRVSGQHGDLRTPAWCYGVHGQVCRRLPRWHGGLWLRHGRVFLVARFHLEEGHQLLQRLRLAAHLLGRGCQFLRGRSVLLRDLVQLRHRGVDLSDAGGLLLRRHRDLLHQVGCLLDRRYHLAQEFSRLLGHRHGASCHLADLPRRYLAALGELSHLARHYREALAVLAGARRLDRGVERQEIRLVGDVVDDPDFLRDLLHRHERLLDCVAAFAGLLRRLHGHAVGNLGVLGVLRDRSGHLLDRSAGFFHARRLLARALAQGLGRGAHLLGGGGQGGRAAPNFADHLRQPTHHFPQGVHHLANLVPGCVRNADGHVSLGKALGAFGCGTQRTGDASGHEERRSQRNHEGQHRDRGHAGQHLVERGGRVFIALGHLLRLRLDQLLEVADHVLEVAVGGLHGGHAGIDVDDAQVDGAVHVFLVFRQLLHNRLCDLALGGVDRRLGAELADLTRHRVDLRDLLGRDLLDLLFLEVADPREQPVDLSVHLSDRARRVGGELVAAEAIVDEILQRRVLTRERVVGHRAEDHQEDDRHRGRYNNLVPYLHGYSPFHSAAGRPL